MRTKQAQHCWYNFTTCRLQTYKPDKTHRYTTFDSLAEYSLWQRLRRHEDKYEIHEQSKIALPDGDIWRVDFRLTATQTQTFTAFARLLNFLYGTEFVSTKYLFVEYKGELDKNFLSKHQLITEKMPITARTIVIVSQSIPGLTYATDKSVTCIPVIPPSVLSTLLAKI